MCGVCGIFDPSQKTKLNSQLDSMVNTLRHRGPDDCGIWFSLDGRVALGHRRLSVIDCSAAGKQPMESKCGRYTIVYNGEIYNYQTIRKELEQDHSIRWDGHSDTEVLLEAISTWGFEEAIKSTNGMFALAVWDKKHKQLLLARDRLGEKPLYYGWFGNQFVFASELKAIYEACNRNLQLDDEALTLFFKI
ncbi:MAG TPA: hypothetical protein EYM90_06920 [Phycisphaerales bacterium]|nr:hypothetical protein [Phycisphaerales bacterium]